MDKKLQDLVWSILPKEFKEEVKKDYNYYAHYGIYEERMWAYIEIFGQDNLTSNVEGEEMLTVSRKRVQEIYSYNEEILSQDPTHAGAKLLKVKLQDLFGSKCLPDNVDSLESNVDSLEPKPAENINIDNPFEKQTPLEPEVEKLIDEMTTKMAEDATKLLREYCEKLDKKPTEPKFKVGDYVRYKGDVHKVVATTRDNRCYLNKIMGSISPSDLEPYTEPEEEVVKMKPIKSKVSVYLATKEEDEEFRMLLHGNGFIWNMGASLISDSHWLSDSENGKMHYVYPDKTVTFYGDKTSDTLTFTKFKKRYFEKESGNLSQETANCNKYPNRDLCDKLMRRGFRDHNRLHIAAMMAQAILARIDDTPQVIAETAFRHADALIKEAKKGVDA